MNAWYIPDYAGLYLLGFDTGPRSVKKNPRRILFTSLRACSSVGRALHSHCRGQGFEFPQVHSRQKDRTAPVFLRCGGRRHIFV